MTPNHDHATLFVAPPSTPGPEATDRRRADDDAEAMRRLRSPFAVLAASERPGRPLEALDRR